MKAVQTTLVSAGVFGLLLGIGCAANERDALHQPVERNYANPADPLERQADDAGGPVPRARSAEPARPVPEPEEGDEDELRASETRDDR